MASLNLGRRSALVLVVAALALTEPLISLNARAADPVPATSTSTTEPLAPGGASTQADLTWGTGPDETGRAQRVMAMAVAGRQVFIGGEFTHMVPPGSSWTMPAPSTTTAAAATATTAAATTSAAASTTTSPSLPPGSEKRGYLAALDIDRHTLLPWDPGADGPVHALLLAPDGKTLYVGGEFDRVGGVPAAKLARIDIATGTVDPTFTPGVRGRVRALALDGDRLYIGGSFNAVTGPAGFEERPKLAALDAATGALLPWMPPPIGPGAFLGHNGVAAPGAGSGDVLAIAAPGDGRRVYVAGSFLDFGGRSGLVVLDSATGGALPQQYSVRRPVFDLDVWPVDGETVFASAGGSGGQVYAFHADQATTPVWATWVDGDSPGVAASDTDVYLMGHYDYAGPKKELRRHLAAFDAATGEVEDWNPVANTPQGAFAAAVGADHVFVGGEFTRINGRPQPGFAQFNLGRSPRPTTTSPATASPATASSMTPRSRATMKG